MEWALFGVVGIATIVAAGAFANKLGVAAPILLILLGVGFSFIPGAPTTVPPEIILAGLLPPILYASAVNVPVVDFRRNFSSIFGLSVLLVLVSAFVTGFLLYLLFPKLTFAAGIAIGAVISPTDAVAATAIGKKLGLPPRLVTILEGEGLVNDATALVLLRSAVAAIAATVSFWGALGDFAYAVLVAIVVGLLVGVITVFVRSKFRDPILDTAISFAVPFIAFIPAEAVHGSGVIAVVVAGLYSGHAAAQRFSPQARISERLNWRTLQFVLENGVFLLMGLEISKLVEDVQRTAIKGEPGVIGSVLLALLMTGVLIVLRGIFVPPLLLIIRARTEAAEKQQSRFRAQIDRLIQTAAGVARLERRSVQAEKAYTRRENDLEQRKAEEFGWRGSVVLSWSGMRGVVTLAAAQSLPDDGSVPYRAQLVLIAFTVAVVTLLLQGGTLPLLIRLTGIPGADRVADRRELASLLDEVGNVGVQVLEHPKLTLPDGEKIDSEVVERVRRDTLLSAESAWERADHGADVDGLVHSPQRQYRALRREVLQAEREALLEARSSGSYASRILNRAQAMLDLEETRLEAIDNPSGL
ncbi:MAG: sodium:proton antiporter [Glaciihabitans sp.]|jgi:NhaP-type Na+/H+ or K+/H+ antiporter|nr:sodium:proton antiporter [Glaciihabitans sp.]